MKSLITTFSEYSKRCEDVQMDSCRGLDYLDLGLCAETSEITGGLIAKSIRGDFMLVDKAPEVMHESGDCCWFADRGCEARGASLALMLNEGDDIAVADKNLFEAGCASRFNDMSDAKIGKQLMFYAVAITSISDDIGSLLRNVQLYFAHLVVLLHRFGYTLVDAVNYNAVKLAERKIKNAIMGHGETIEERVK